MTTVLRAVAVGIAIGALVDPGIAALRTAPVPLEIVIPPPAHPEHEGATALAAQLRRAAEGIATDRSPQSPAAQVLIAGPPQRHRAVPAYVLHAPVASPSIEIVATAGDESSVPGQAVRVLATVRSVGLEGKLVRVEIADRDVTITSREHKPTSAQEDASVAFEFVPSGTGVQRFRIRASAEGVDPVHVDTAVRVLARRLRVLIYEPRPSWNATFIRRALESDPRFELSAVARSNRRVATDVNAAPRSLNRADANAYDVVVAGAPEELSGADLAFLDRFVAERGGGLVLAPDRRLSPSVPARFGLPAMHEQLLQEPVEVQTAAGSLRASELLLGTRASTSVHNTLGIARLHEGERAAMLSVDRGEGVILLSGLLDGWRYRADEDGQWNAFWRGLLAELALAAPRRLEVRSEPAIARTGERVRVVASWRQDAISNGTVVEVPPVTAWMTTASGEQMPIRLWPGERAGIYEGTVIPAIEGLHAISVRGPGAAADAVVRVENDSVRAIDRDEGAGRLLAELSGGATVADVSELTGRLAQLPRPQVHVTSHPMRSPLWLLPFAGCLCAEWFLRRRRGQR